MSKMKQFLQEKLEKRAPKGVDPKKHERCVKDVKKQGHDIGSAYAICTASMKKASPMDATTKKLADKIIAHNRKKLHGSKIEKSKKDKKKKVIDKVKRKKVVPQYYPLGCITNENPVEKSIDFQETKTSVDSTDQLLAEKTASPQLIKYIKDSIANEISKIPFAKGTLTLSEKEKGLYNGFFQDAQGQIVEKFDSMTPEIVAKNMELKQLFSMATPASTINPPANPEPTAEQVAFAAHDRIDMVQNQIHNMQKEPMKELKSLRVRFGDFELELRKSVKDFAQKFAKARIPLKEVDHDLVKKAISCWQKQHKEVLDVSSMTSAAKEIFENWEEHKEGFSQIVYALQQLERGDE